MKTNCCDVNVGCTGRSCTSCPNPSNSCVSLTYQDIYDDYWPDMTGAIEHQFEWQELRNLVADKVLEVQKEFGVPLNKIVPGTEPNPATSVYGYNSDGTLDLTGGREKTYNPKFKCFRFSYSGAKEAIYPIGPGGAPVTIPLDFLTPGVAKGYYDQLISYFASRGFSLQKSDTFKKFKYQYIWSYPAGQNQGFNGSNGYVALRVIWECRHGKKVPAYVDLHATANNTSGQVFVLDTYQPDPALRENGHGYPLRIPITTDFCGTFQNMYNAAPIAFFDKKCKVLTIRVPENDQGYFLTKRIVNTGNPALNIDYEEHLKAFDGSFLLLHKKDNGQLAKTNFKCADIFAQVSDSVHIKSHVVNFGTPRVPDFELFNPIRSAALAPTTTAIYYTGVVCPKMNGGTPSYNTFIIPRNQLNSYSIEFDPLQIPEQGEYGEGDNPGTNVVEQYSIPSNITLFDNPDWNKVTFALPHDVITAQSSFPENLATTPVPSNISNVEAMRRVIFHEFTHAVERAAGVPFIVPFEGMATGIELDTRAVGDIFSVGRAQRFTQFHIRLTRGMITMMTPEFAPFTTYGLGLFWKYIQDQFDFNNQSMRRSMDILTSQTMGPLFKANDFPDTDSIFILNSNGGSAALQQAFSELFSRNIKDVWNDFSISLVLLRNNSSIPAKYRSSFPYWIYNPQYAGYPTILQGSIVNNTSQFANWWQAFETNAIIPANYGAGSVGQTFVRTLPSTLNTSLPNLKTVSFNVPRSLNTITITVTAGEWRLTLLQFTSDGTPVGSFIEDGPHTIVGAGVHVFNVAGHVPAFTATGNIRLVCANVTFTGTGTILADYFQPEALTGTISIVSA